MKHYNYGEQDFIPCRFCGNQAVDIHHIDPKGMGGRKGADVIENLVALCRTHHEDAHSSKITKEELRNLL